MAESSSSDPTGMVSTHTELPRFRLKDGRLTTFDWEEEIISMSKYKSSHTSAKIADKLGELGYCYITALDAYMLVNKLFGIESKVKEDNWLPKSMKEDWSKDRFLGYLEAFINDFITSEGFHYLDYLAATEIGNIKRELQASFAYCFIQMVGANPALGRLLELGLIFEQVCNFIENRSEEEEFVILGYNYIVDANREYHKNDHMGFLETESYFTISYEHDPTVSMKPMVDLGYKRLKWEVMHSNMKASMGPRRLFDVYQESDLKFPFKSTIRGKFPEGPVFVSKNGLPADVEELEAKGIVTLRSKLTGKENAIGAISD